MHWYLYVRLERFYVTCLREREGGSDHGIILFRDKQVWDCSENVAKLGVRVGIPLSEARALARGSCYFREFQPHEFDESKKKWLDICVNMSDRIQTDDPHEAWIDLSNHPRPCEMAKQLLKELNAAGYQARCALANSLWVGSLALDLDDRPFVDVKDSKEYLASVGIDRLYPVEPLIRERLAFLGYRRIGDLRVVPAFVLRRHFGRAQSIIVSTCRGYGGAIFRANYPPKSIQTSICFDFPLNDRQTLDHAIDKLVHEISGKLRNQDKQVQKLTLLLEQEDWSVTKLSHMLSKAAQTSFPIKLAIEQMLEKADLTRGISSIRLIASELEVCQRSQLRLLSREHSDRILNAADTQGVLANAFGHGSVELASHLIPERRKQVLKAWGKVYGWK